jgi:uncharacterized membrane protein (DUF2068 family)
VSKAANSPQLREHARVRALLEEPRRRRRYLKAIALFKITKGVLLLILGVSILFLRAHDTWLDAISDWADDEILLHHSKTVHFLLNKVQDVLAGGTLRATGFVALFYCSVLFTEGIGVWMEKRWAEWLMICATGTLIPLETRHLWHQVVSHQPFIAAAAILLVNCFIVWFLYLVLKRGKSEAPIAAAAELVETR